MAIRNGGSSASAKLANFLRTRSSPCQHVYLDVGSNIGVQIRKLFEPTKYPGYKVASTFNKHFGALGSSRQKNVCALGLEANPRHAPRLAEIAAAYNARGWRTHFLAPVAASVANGKVTFYPGPVDHDSGGGGRVATRRSGGARPSPTSTTARRGPHRP